VQGLAAATRRFEIHHGLAGDRVVVLEQRADDGAYARIEHHVLADRLVAMDVQHARVALERIGIEGAVGVHLGFPVFGDRFAGGGEIVDDLLDRGDLRLGPELADDQIAFGAIEFPLGRGEGAG